MRKPTLLRLTPGGNVPTLLVTMSMTGNRYAGLLPHIREAFYHIASRFRRRLASASVIYFLMVISATAQTANTTYDPELVNTAHSGAELFRLWKGKYPALCNFGSSDFNGDMIGFLTRYVIRDHEIQAGRTGRALAQEIVRINKNIDDYIAKHPDRKPPPELYVIKSRINFEVYSESALTSFTRQIEKQKSGGPVRLEQLERSYRELMQDAYFAKKDQLRQVKADFDAWREQSIEQNDATLAKLATLNENLRLSLDGLNKGSFAEQDPRIKAQIDEIRALIAQNGIKRSSADGAQKQLLDFGLLLARYTNTTATLQSDARVAAIVESQQAVAKRQQAAGRVASILIGSAALILLISVILHAKGKIVFFADYTDATMTFFGPIAIVIFIGLCSVASAFITNPDYQTLAFRLAVLSGVAVVAFFGFRNSYFNNRNVVLATLAFLSKYILSATYLLLVYAMLAGGEGRRKGESEVAFERRRRADAWFGLIVATIFTAITAFFVRYLVKNRRFSPFANYFSTSWTRRSPSNSGSGNTSDSMKGDADQPHSEGRSGNGAANAFPVSEEPDVPDNYKTLGISEDATEDEIKDAYRHKIQQYHPDKVPPHLGIELRDFAEKKSKEINRAYEELRSRGHKENASE